jgi:hypothetical protein
MTTVTFDTHAMIESLIKEGVKKEQAEAIINVVREGMQLDISHLITKDYFDTNMDNRLLALENKLIYWIIGNSLAIIAILSGLKIFGVS